MSAIDVIGMVGEVISWFGAVVGVPLIVVAVLIRAIRGNRHPSPHPATRFCTVLGLTMLGAAAVGFVLSLLPLFW